MTTREQMEGPRRGVWVAYFGDFSGVVIFETELEALRYANSMGGMLVAFAHFGDEDWGRRS